MKLKFSISYSGLWTSLPVENCGDMLDEDDKTGGYFAAASFARIVVS